MRIHILGINHQVQPADIRSWSSNGLLQRFEQEQKDRYAALVDKLIADTGAQIVAEEAEHGLETMTKRACDRVKCRAANIEMPPDERTARGIPAGYNENPDTPPHDRERWNQEREEFMAAKVMMEASEAESAIVICGRMHVQPLAERFTKAGHTVERSDLQDQAWYVEDWQTHMMRL